MSLMFSKRGARLRIVDGFKFRRYKCLANGDERWVCTNKNCRAFMKCNGGTVTDSNFNHNHPSDNGTRLMRQVVANACKRRAQDDVFERPSKIMRKEMTREALEVLTESDRAQIRKSISYARGKDRPPLPTTLEALHDTLATMEVKTKLEENFVLVNDEVTNIVMFSTAKNLTFLQSCDTVLMDGTFKSCPLLFTQLFIVHGRKRSTYVPLAYFLLSGQDTEQYQRALTKLSAFLPFSYSPTAVFADFELSIHVAVRHVWPSTSIHGCRFHLGQSWFRKIQQLGLVKTYRSASAEGSYLRAFFGMPYLKPETVEEFFIESLGPREPACDPKINEFSAYVYNTYIKPTARFPPTIWAKYSNEISRTTNACEGFHGRLNGMFYQAHPNIYLLIDGLLEVQERAYTKMISTDVTKKRNESIAKENFIADVMYEFESGTIDIYDYVKKISRKFLP